MLVNNAGVSRQIDYPYWDHNDADAVAKALWQGVDEYVYLLPVYIDSNLTAQRTLHVHQLGQPKRHLLYDCGLHPSSAQG